MDTSFLTRYLYLFHCESVSTVIFSRLLHEFGSIANLTTQLEKTLLAAGLPTTSVSAILKLTADSSTQSNIDNDLDWSARPNHSIVCYESELYPPLLREISCAPPLLYVIGNKSALLAMQFAIVGSRKASAYGSKNAYWMAHELSVAGLTICSGLATGIDSRAHSGALDSGNSTIAVMGTGADLVYPANSQQLAERIVENGALVSEFALRTKPLAHNFPRRNRIISGMSLGTLVIEATRKSGSLITARLALEQNRDVFAIPGSISSQLSGGVHRLIKEGAKLVEDPNDILEELITPGTPFANSVRNASKTQTPEADMEPAASKESQLILDVMGYQGCLMQTLLERTGLDWQQINSQLLELEMLGRVQTDGGRYIRVK